MEFVDTDLFVETPAGLPRAHYTYREPSGAGDLVLDAFVDGRAYVPQERQLLRVQQSGRRSDFVRVRPQGHRIDDWWFRAGHERTNVPNERSLYAHQLFGPNFVRFVQQYPGLNATELNARSTKKSTKFKSEKSRLLGVSQNTIMIRWRSE